MFKTISLQGTSKNTILSISNEQDWVNIITNHYQIQPGYTYTFKVVASQIITTQRFEAMKLEDRKCFLSREGQNISIMKNYTKGGCQYECAIDQIVKTCNCTPWNIPKIKLNNPPFCEDKFVPVSAGFLSCTDMVLSSFSAKECRCPSNCVDTIFSVFDYKESMENPGFNCYEARIFDRKKGVYPFNIFCDLCRKALKLHKVWFIEIFKELNLASHDDFPKFCNDFLMNNVALIKVEMAAPSLTQSVRDKRFNFAAQLSDLGKLSKY